MIAELEFTMLADIKYLYPNQWVLVGDPVLKNENLQTTLIINLEGGVVLDHDPNRHTLALRAKKMREGFASVVLVYTGEVPRNRKFLL